MKRRYAKVEGHPNLLRDLHTNAIINTDSISAINYDNSMEIKKNQLKDIETIKSELDQLKNSIEEIKNLLRSLNNGP